MNFNDAINSELQTLLNRIDMKFKKRWNDHKTVNVNIAVMLRTAGLVIKQQQQLVINQSNQDKLLRRTTSQQKLQQQQQSRGLKRTGSSGDLINIKYICEPDKTVKCSDDNRSLSDMDNGNEKVSKQSPSANTKVNTSAQSTRLIYIGR